jgi:uncharacterized protein (DUF433 family)
MDTDKLLERITIRPDVFGGKPIIRDMRISVEMVLALLAQGAGEADILEDYPELERDDVRACLAFARAMVAHDRIDRVRVAGG